MYEGDNVRALEPAEREQLVDHVMEHGNDVQVVSVRTLLATGLRASELAHLRPSWLRPDAAHAPRISVPGYEDCECSDCQQKAEQSAASAAGDREPTATEVSEALEQYWQPKSSRGSRTIPVTDQEAWELLEAWVAEHDGFGLDRWKIHYEVTKLNGEAGVEAKVAPHLLRHSFATAAVEDGVQLSTLQNVMGHADPKTTASYVRIVGDQAAQELAEVRSDG